MPRPHPRSLTHTAIGSHTRLQHERGTPDVRVARLTVRESAAEAEPLEGGRPCSDGGQRALQTQQR